MRAAGGRLLVTGAAIGSVALIAIAEPMAPAGRSAVEAGDGPGFSPPPTTAIPDGPAGDAIRRGQAIFDNPALHAAEYVGNAMACRNCHLDSGRRAGSSPMWAAWGGLSPISKEDGFDQHDGRPHHWLFHLFDECVEQPVGRAASRRVRRQSRPRSLFPLARNRSAYWPANGGRGISGGSASRIGYDPGRGAPLYEQKCSGCHGSDGQGAAQPDGKIVYPPLWGRTELQLGRRNGSGRSCRPVHQGEHAARPARHAVRSGSVGHCCLYRQSRAPGIPDRPGPSPSMPPPISRASTVFTAKSSTASCSGSGTPPQRR